MKIGLSEWSLHQHFGRMVENPRPWTAFDLLDLAGQWKLDAVQIESIGDDPAVWERLRQRADELGLTVEVEAGGIEPTVIRRKLQAAKALGAEVVRSFPDLDRYDKHSPLEKQLGESEAKLREIAEAAEEMGIYVAFENHQSLVTDRVTRQDIRGPELADLLDRVDSPFIGCCLDPGNAFGYLDDPLETSRRLASRTLSVHFKDYRLKRTFRGAEFAGCALGAGVIDLPGILSLLKAHSPRGEKLCLQIESPVERIQVPFLDADFWDGYEPEEAERIPAFLRLIEEKGDAPETDLRLPAETGAPLDEVLAHEMEFNRKSVEYLRALLAQR